MRICFKTCDNDSRQQLRLQAKAEIQAAGKAAKTRSWVSASWNLIDAKNIQTYARITLQLSLAACGRRAMPT